MDKRTGAILATVATALFCGCPGFFALCYGLITAFVAFIPGSDLNFQGDTTPTTALFVGLVSICLGVIFIAIPVLVGFFTLRQKPEPIVDINEPLPPSI
jgi:hypothetical protein